MLIIVLFISRKFVISWDKYNSWEIVLIKLNYYTNPAYFQQRTHPNSPCQRGKFKGLNHTKVSQNFALREILDLNLKWNIRWTKRTKKAIFNCAYVIDGQFRNLIVNNTDKKKYRYYSGLPFSFQIDWNLAPNAARYMGQILLHALLNIQIICGFFKNESMICIQLIIV